MGSTFHDACSRAATESLGSLYRNEMPLIKNVAGLGLIPDCRPMQLGVKLFIHQSYERLSEKRHKMAQQVGSLKCAGVAGGVRRKKAQIDLALPAFSSRY